MGGYPLGKEAGYSGDSDYTYQRDRRRFVLPRSYFGISFILTEKGDLSTPIRGDIQLSGHPLTYYMLLYMSYQNGVFFR